MLHQFTASSMRYSGGMNSCSFGTSSLNELRREWEKDNGSDVRVARDRLDVLLRANKDLRKNLRHRHSYDANFSKTELTSGMPGLNASIGDARDLTRSFGKAKLGGTIGLTKGGSIGVSKGVSTGGSRVPSTASVLCAGKLEPLGPLMPAKLAPLGSESRVPTTAPSWLGKRNDVLPLKSSKAPDLRNPTGNLFTDLRCTRKEDAPGGSFLPGASLHPNHSNPTPTADARSCPNTSRVGVEHTKHTPPHSRPGATLNATLTPSEPPPHSSAGGGGGGGDPAESDDVSPNRIGSHRRIRGLPAEYGEDVNSIRSSLYNELIQGAVSPAKDKGKARAHTPPSDPAAGCEGVAVADCAQDAPPSPVGALLVEDFDPEDVDNLPLPGEFFELKSLIEVHVNLTEEMDRIETNAATISERDRAEWEKWEWEEHMGLENDAKASLDKLNSVAELLCMYPDSMWRMHELYTEYVRHRLDLQGLDMEYEQAFGGLDDGEEGLGDEELDTLEDELAGQMEAAEESIRDIRVKMMEVLKQHLDSEREAKAKSTAARQAGEGPSQ